MTLCTLLLPLELDFVAICIPPYRLACEMVFYSLALENLCASLPRPRRFALLRRSRGKVRAALAPLLLFLLYRSRLLCRFCFGSRAAVWIGWWSVSLLLRLGGGCCGAACRCRWIGGRWRRRSGLLTACQHQTHRPNCQ